MLKTEKSINEEKRNVEEGKTRYLLILYVSPEQVKPLLLMLMGPRYLGR